jgi:transcriptional regulator
MAGAVPTWNYSVVHAHGTIRFVEDHDHGLRHVRALTDHQEPSRPEHWKASDAPVDFIESLLSRIMPFEIPVARLIGKFKASQHRPESERVTDVDCPLLAVLTRSIVGRPPMNERLEVL